MNTKNSFSSTFVFEFITKSILLLALWYSLRPYKGIDNDARMYLVQTLKRLGKSSFDDDLFLKFGSQDKFSIFSRLFAPLVDILGPSTAHAVGAFLGQALWIGSALLLCRVLFKDDRLFKLSALAAMLMVPFYGWGEIKYSEEFLTPRLFAESFVLLAIALYLKKKPAYVALCMACAFALHPIMALPGFALIFFMVARTHRWSIAIAAAAVALCLVLAFAGVDPFARLLVQLDPEWYAIVQARSPQLFIQE